MSRDDSVDRREFLKTSSAAGLGIVASSAIGSSPLRALAPSTAANVGIAVIGLNGRGVVHAQNLAKMANAELRYICDVDSNVLTKSAAAVAKANPQGKAPKQVGDFRRILDDPAVDAIVISTRDHWHTPMTMLAVNANKHVYLEKPSGHDAREDELVVESTAKHGRLVQLGAQRRSGPKFFEALQALKDGVIGTPYLARTWYANTRTGIGIGTPAPVPANLDYELWQGPAPRTP
ncbi:MAG TPA: Gfo/Idh/MocA family oxidoreductase, partial [Gemmatimonadaceae bacterium]|nr:Gfo/Idh/MocA family oxidoreductase [Gemmatimonadaceae bacterium]